MKAFFDRERFLRVLCDYVVCALAVLRRRKETTFAMFVTERFLDLLFPHSDKCEVSVVMVWLKWRT